LQGQDRGSCGALALAVLFAKENRTVAYNGIGAYFSSSGAPIRQGAAGIGSFFSGEVPPVHAFREGSLGEYFGGDNAAEAAPPVFAFQDGVLGGPRGSSDGPLRAYKD